MKNKIKVNILGRGKFFGYKVPAYNVYIDRELYDMFIKQKFHGITLVPVVDNNSSENSSNSSSSFPEEHSKSQKEGRKAYTEQELVDILNKSKKENDDISLTSLKNSVGNRGNKIPEKAVESQPNFSDIDADINAEIEKNIKSHLIINNIVTTENIKKNIDYDQPFYSEEELRKNYEKEDLAKILCFRGHNWSTKRGRNKDKLAPRHRDSYDELLEKVLKSNKSQ